MAFFPDVSRDASPFTVTSHSGNNAHLMKQVVRLYVKEGAVVLDATYGKGKFWSGIDKTSLALTTNDMTTPADFHYDFRKFPKKWRSSFDVVVFDPPYAYSPKKTMKDSLANCYQLNGGVDISSMEKVWSLYTEGIDEAYRVLKKGGLLMVKCQDIIEAGKQWWMHVKVMTQFPAFYCKDLFVLTQTGRPMVDPKWKVQRHARKNHSFLVILQKR